jgi:hypothetical protein
LVTSRNAYIVDALISLEAIRNGLKLLIVEGDDRVMFSLKHVAQPVTFLTQCLEAKVAQRKTSGLDAR